MADYHPAFISEPAMSTWTKMHEAELDNGVPPSSFSRIVLKRKRYYLDIAKKKFGGENGQVDIVSYQHHNEVYILSTYDRLRMKLLRDDQDFYLAFKETMRVMREHFNEHRRRGHIPKFKTFSISVLQNLFLLLTGYLLFLLMQVFIMNPLVVLAGLYTEYKIYGWTDKKIRNHRININ